mgnify:CR=1 FL=1
MLKKIFSLIGILCIVAYALAEDTTRVYNQVSIHDICPSASKLAVLLPYPESNMYQEIVGERHGNGTVRSTSDNRSYLLFYLNNNQLPEEGDLHFCDTFDIVYKEVSVDFDAIDSNAQYDIQSDDYKQYLSEAMDNDFIRPHHPYIDSIANIIWMSSNQTILDYARKCYLYVAEHLTYQLFGEGLLPLDTVIVRQRGECGDFTTLLVNLLRNKNIPARHVASFKADGTFHVWCEFLLPGYGWVPVDATYKNGNPYGNYFGEYHEQYVVSHVGINLKCYCWTGVSPNIVLLQSFVWFYLHSGGLCNNITAEREISYETATGTLNPDIVSNYSVEKDFTISVSNRNLSIDAPESKYTVVYNLSGQVVKSIDGCHGTVTLPTRGIYIVSPQHYKARKIVVF